MSNDTDLLRRFVALGSDSDFRELVRQNASMVYHAALRRTGGQTDLAEEVTQRVFIALAQSAPKLVQHTSLAGWLYTTTRHTAQRILRDERRRRDRERTSAVMTELQAPEAKVVWEKLRPELDRLLDQLPDADREAVLLRYVQGHSLAEIGAALGLNSDATRKRIERAVERLRRVLTKRGCMTSTAVIAELLADEATAAVPPSLVEKLTGAALAKSLPVASASLTALGGSAAVLSGVAAMGLAIAVLGGAATATAWSSRTANTAEAKAAALAGTLRVSEARLRIVRAEMERAAPAATPVLANRAAALTPTATDRGVPSGGAQATADALANGAQFLASVPEARVRLTSFEKTQLRAVFAGLYREARLTPAEIDAFEQRVIDYHLSAIELSGDRMVTSAGDLPVDQVGALLGQDRARTYEKYLTEMPARRLALEAAATVNYTSTSASPAQVDELTRVLADGNPGYQSAGKMDWQNEDWSAVVPKLKALFAPEQWNAVEGLFLGYAYRQALQRAQAAATQSGGTAGDASPRP